MKYFLLSLLIVSLSCDKATKHTAKRITLSKADLYKPHVKSDTMLIEADCCNTAVSYIPDSLQLERMKQKLGEEDFYTIADDANYYQSEAAGILEGSKLAVRYVKDVKYIRFVNKLGKSMIVNTDTLSLFNLFLFDRDKLPRMIDITDTNAEYDRYFSTK